MRSRQFGALGVDFAVQSPDAELVATLNDLFRDLHNHQRATGPVRLFDVSPTRTGSSGYDVSLNGDLHYRSVIESATVSHLLIEVNRIVAASCRRQGAIPLHAATVATVDGRAIVVTGESHSGKTTLATAVAVTTGAEHVMVADEVSALDPDALTIAPYGKPVALRPSAVALLAPHVPRFDDLGSRFERTERFVPPSELGHWGLTVGTADDPTATTLVFPRFVPGATPAMVPVPPAEALIRLMNLTLGGIVNTAREFRALERLVRQTAAFELTHGHAIDAAELLRGLQDHGVGAENLR